MNSKDYFKDMYTDFFKVEKEEEKEIENNSLEKSSQKEMTTLFDRINNLYINEESKELLKKIIEYMRKYQEKIEKNYVNFNLILETNNSETKNEVIDILFESSQYCLRWSWEE